MNTFMDSDFLLSGSTAKYLYHEVASGMPVFDFHSHLNPMDIYEDKPYENLYQLWLEHDHYKWRAMRAGGICEELITGNGRPYEKFLAWASIVPGAIGNPLYHWTHLELQRYFAIYDVLSPLTAEKIWTEANRAIAEKRLSPRKLLRMQNVKKLCTSDDIAQGLEGHRLLKSDKTLDIEVYPTFRLDPLFGIDEPGFADYIKSLADEVKRPLSSFASLLEALMSKLNEYQSYNCRTGDHGLAYIPYRPMEPAQVEDIYQKRLVGKSVTPEETEGFQTALLLFLFPEYKRRRMVVQLHIGSLRNGNSAVFKSIGGAAGCDSMHDMPVALQLNSLLDHLNSLGMLPEILLFNINPSMNYMLATLGGNFSSSEIPGKVQLGPAWWLLDHKDGIEAQLVTFANCGLLSTCVGMLTDSRSFLSYTRHEYYRRILCNLLGKWVEAGEYPADRETLSQMVRNICYGNACRFFSLPAASEVF